MEGKPNLPRDTPEFFWHKLQVWNFLKYKNVNKKLYFFYRLLVARGMLLSVLVEKYPYLASLYRIHPSFRISYRCTVNTKPTIQYEKTQVQLWQNYVTCQKIWHMSPFSSHLGNTGSYSGLTSTGSYFNVLGESHRFTFNGSW